MKRHADDLSLESETPSERRARLLAEEDLDLMFELVRQRRDKGISQADLADLMGVTQATVAAFERVDNDPKLSTIRRYAWAVGALVHHAVEGDSGVAGYYSWNRDAVVHVNFTPSTAEHEARSGWREYPVAK